MWRHFECKCWIKFVGFIFFVKIAKILFGVVRVFHEIFFSLDSSGAAFDYSLLSNFSKRAHVHCKIFVSFRCGCSEPHTFGRWFQTSGGEANVQLGFIQSGPADMVRKQRQIWVISGELPRRLPTASTRFKGSRSHNLGHRMEQWPKK